MLETGHVRIPEQLSCYKAPINKTKPAVLFYGRETNIKLPSSPVYVNTKTETSKSHVKAKHADKNAKLRMKVYADKRRNAKRSKLRTGDTVLVQQDKQNKFTTPFDPKPYEIIEKKGSMVTAQREDKQITRDTSNFKSVGAGTQNTNIQDSAKTRNTNNQSSADTDNTNVKSSGETDTPRRSSRNKTPPAYLKDYVC